MDELLSIETAAFVASRKPPVRLMWLLVLSAEVSTPGSVPLVSVSEPPVIVNNGPLTAVTVLPPSNRTNGPLSDRSVFVICSGMAAIGGIVAASRANSVDPNTGGSNILLYAVGAAVIGGTSLFGGKGRVLDAILGGAVVAVIDNGMGLMGVSAGVKYVITGGVLLLAAGVDALSRRRAAATGLR